MLRRNKISGDQATRSAPEQQDGDIFDPDVPLKNPAAMLGEILLEKHVIDAEQLEEGLAKRDEEGGFLGQKLIELGYLDQDTLTQLLVKQCKIPHINLLDYQIEPDVAKLIPKDLSLKHRIVPIDKMGHILTIAMVDPLNAEALMAVRNEFPELRIKPILCDWPHFEIVFKGIHSAPASESEESDKDDLLSGLKLPPKAPKRKAAKASKAAATDADASTPGDASAGTGNLSPQDLSTAVGATVSQLLPTLLKEMREEIISERSGLDTDGNAGAPAMTAIEKKLEQLAHSVSQIAQASDVFQAARRAEESSVATSLRNDLESGGAPPSSGGDATPDVDLTTASPLDGYSFETFIEGENNSVALEIAKAIAESPGTLHNPLFICGDVGLGKTHLINAIGNHITKHSKEMKVGYTSANRFAEHVTSTFEQHMSRAFRAAYGQWDVLILDDIQFLAGHVEAQEELFHIFNSLHQDDKQIVIAGDKAPQKLGLLEERLVSRFEGGMLSHLLPPDWATRIAILETHAKAAKADVPNEVLAMISMKYAKDVRRLLGCLHRVIAHAQLKKCSVSCELANEVLSEDGVNEAA